MSEPVSPKIPLPPRWLMVIGSAAILFHLGSVAAHALAAGSGPWYIEVAGYAGPSEAQPPHFATLIDRDAAAPYLFPLRLSHNYHFNTNRPGSPGVYFEVTLRDRGGAALKTLKFPDEQANFLARHREGLLARALANDIPVAPPGPEQVAAPGQDLNSIPIWYSAEPQKPGPMVLKKVLPHEVPRGVPVFRPSEWSLLVAQSYARYLCREHGAATAEIVRHSQQPVPPMVLLVDENQAKGMTGVKMIASFGEYPR